MQRLLIYYALKCFSAMKKVIYPIIVQLSRLEEEVAEELVVEAHVLLKLGNPMEICCCWNPGKRKMLFSIMLLLVHMSF
jgi:hypothetical protein